MSLHQIFDAIWNFPIPWLWILGMIGAVVAVLVLIAAFIGNEIRKEGRNVPKP